MPFPRMNDFFSYSVISVILLAVTSTHANAGVIEEATDYLSRNCGAMQMFGGRVKSQVSIDKDGEIFIPDTGEESARNDYRFSLKEGRFHQDDGQFKFICDDKKCITNTIRIVQGIHSGRKREDSYKIATFHDKNNPSVCSAGSIAVFQDLERHFRGDKPKQEKAKPRTRYD